MRSGHFLRCPPSARHRSRARPDSTCLVAEANPAQNHRAARIHQGVAGDVPALLENSARFDTDWDVATSPLICRIASPRIRPPTETSASGCPRSSSPWENSGGDRPTLVAGDHADLRHALPCARCIVLRVLDPDRSSADRSCNRRSRSAAEKRIEYEPSFLAYRGSSVTPHSR